MQLKKVIGLMACWSLLLSTAWGQTANVIYLNNPSFEGEPRAGLQPDGWIDCGQVGETPPDVQPFGGFNVSKVAKEGRTYLGLVTRYNDTWESVAQRLSEPLQGGECYKFTLHLARSAAYRSSTKRSRGRIVNFDDAVKVRIWGSNSSCGKTELLDETDLIEHTSWRAYEFKLKPSSDYAYLRIEAYFKTPTLFAYNGNVLIDDASPLIPCKIPTDEQTPPVAVNERPKPKPKPNPKPKPTPKPTPKVLEPQPSNEEVARNNKGRFDFNTNVKELKKGDTYQLDNIYFPADSSSVTRTSEPTLQKLASFLKNNTNIYVEIGGHTNSRPPEEYCDRLSQARAKKVASYLATQGVDPAQLTYKGYGKRQPIATNQTAEGRRKNQRVEVKVIEVE